jgi:hypothetical protein
MIKTGITSVLLSQEVFLRGEEGTLGIIFKKEEASENVILQMRKTGQCGVSPAQPARKQQTQH